MPIGRGELGFLLVVVFVVLVIVFEIRRRWRRSVERGEEVMRLVARVAEEEEAERADFEAAMYVAVDPRPVRFDSSTVGYDSRPVEMDRRSIGSDSSTLGYDPRPVRFESSAVGYDSRPVEMDRRSIGSDSSTVGYDSRPVRFDSSAAGYNSRPVEVDRRSIGSDSGSLQYYCALCFAPATTRCSKCKAARYCSGKCQILHWREGHKNECRPFTTHQQLYDAGGGSSQKASFPKERHENQKNSSDSVGGSSESAQNFESSSFPADISEKRDDAAECLAAPLHRGMSPNETEKRNGHALTTDQITTSDKPNQIEPSTTKDDVHYGSKGSSNQDANGIPEISISDPYTPFSGFWERTINSGQSKVDSNDEFSQLNSPYKSDKKSDHSNGVKGFGNMKVEAGMARFTNVGKEKLVGVNIQSNEKSEFVPSSSSEKSDGIHVSETRDFAGPKLKQNSRAERSAVSAKPTNGSTTKPLNPQEANQVIHGVRSITDPMISRKDETSSSVSSVNLVSTTGRQSLLGVELGKDDHVRTSDATSFDFPRSLPSSKNGFKTSMLKVVDQLRPSKTSRQSGLGSEITSRYNGKGLFSYEQFVKLYNWKTVDRIQPCGLLNCGNSCYANVVLQCLVFTPPLTAYLLQGLHSKACKQKERCFTCEFQSLTLKAKESNSPLSPAAILSYIDKTKSHFGNGKEEDAHEFLRYVIDTMQLANLREVGLHPSGSLEEETTLTGLTFGGYLRSKIKCSKCGAKSEQCERMMDLTVEIEGDVGTLDEALRKFTSTEIMDGENKYQCSRCRSYERAKKKFRILEAPNVLTIAFKRFQLGTFGKINKWIRFPEVLDLAPYMSGTSDKSPIYRLYGVIVHLDSMNATYTGHYICYVKNAENKWFEIDDSRVKLVDLQSVLANRAYLLLYARCSPRAPKSIRNQRSRDSENLKSPPVNLRSHSVGTWNYPTTDPINDHYNAIGSLHPSDLIFKEDTWSESASSIFSEEYSSSTESSNKDYSSTDDRLDFIFGNYGNDRINSWRNSSDSESTSSSSSGGSIKENVQVLDSNSTKDCRKFASSNSCRESHSSRLGWANPFGKKSGLLFRRSVRERTS